MNLSTALVATFSIFGGFALCCGCGADDAEPSAAAANTGGNPGSGTGGTQSTAGAAGAGGAVECPTVQCTDRNGGMCFSCWQPVTGIPFVRAAVAGTDKSGSTATLRQETDGVCLSGNNTTWVGLVFAFSDVAPEPPLPACGADGPKYDRAFIEGLTFDATALGITQVAFTVDSPPSAGVLPTFVEDAQDPAFDSSECVQLSQFSLRTAGGGWTERSITETTPVTVPFTDFVLANWEPVVYVDFEPSRIANLVFFYKGATGSFDFCIRNLRFLDANGAEVTP